MTTFENSFGTIQFKAILKLCCVWLWFTRKTNSNLYQFWYRNSLRYPGHTIQFSNQNSHVCSIISTQFQNCPILISILDPIMFEFISSTKSTQNMLKIGGVFMLGTFHKNYNSKFNHLPLQVLKFHVILIYFLRGRYFPKLDLRLGYY